MSPVESVFYDFVQLFERLGVPYAVMGGLAVRAHGIPRPTYDVDVTVLAERGQLSHVIGEIRRDVSKDRTSENHLLRMASSRGWFH